MPRSFRAARLLGLALLPLLLPLPPALAQDFEIDEASLGELRKAVFPLVEKETGVSLEGIALRTCGVEELRKILEEELAPQFKVMHPEPEAARAQAAGSASVLAGAMLAKFATAARAVLVCPGNVDALSRKIDEPLLRTREGLCAVLAHEAAHAADELRFGFSKSILDRKDAQALQAMNAVIEGHAQVVARRVCEAGGWTAGFEAFRRSIGKEAPDAGEGEGNRYLARIVTASVASAYWDGETFMAALVSKGGDKAVERAFRDPPADLETISHPGWFLDPASRPALAFDFDAALGVLEKEFGPEAWTMQRQALAGAQLRAALSLLPPADVEWIAGTFKTSRMTVLNPKANPGAKMVVALLAEFATPADALFYMAAAERLARIKDEKMREGAVTIAEAAYETLHGEGWIGVCASKTVKAGPGSVRVLDLVATSGSLSLELLYSGEETTPAKLAELAGRLLAAARVAKPAPDPGTAPVSPPPSDGSPREAFETMVRAVRGKDLGLYKSCFTEEALKGEAGLELFEKDPEKFWAELGATFKGPQTLTLEGPLPEEGRVKGKVEAPEADRGGIGTLTFLKEGGRWKIHRW